MTSEARPPPWRVPGVALGILLWIGWSAWARPLLLPDEGRYVGVAWEMLRSGDWLTPTLDGLPYFHKPPLFYWITAGAFSLLGPGVWAARLAPVLGATLGSLALYLFVRRWVGGRAARLGLVALLAQPLWLVGGQFANLDMLVAGCITATVLLLAHAALCRERDLPHRRTLLAGYGMAAVGVLAKGLIGAVLPALVIGLWLLLRGRWRVLLAMLSWRGALLFALLAAPWFVAMQGRFPAFLDYFFVVQHFKRFAEGGFNNAQPFWFFPAVLLLFGLPWLPWLAAWRHWRRDGGDTGRAVRLLMAVWLCAVVAFFSLPQSKLVGYVLPAVPPLAFLFADLAGSRPATAAMRRLWGASAGLAAAAGLGAVAWLALHPVASTREIALSLGAQHHAGEPVFMLDEYYFDLPFYARLDAPVAVVDHWDDPAIRRLDNWRKELIDAGDFAPGAAAQVLVRPESLDARLCTAPASWVVGQDKLLARYPFLAAAEAVRVHERTTLWRVDARRPELIKALACEGRPNAGSASR